MTRVVVIRTQNILIPAASDSGSCGSGARGSGTNAKLLSPAARVSGTNAKFSKSSRAW